MKNLIIKSFVLFFASTFILFVNSCTDTDLVTEKEGVIVVGSTRTTIPQNIPFIWDDINNPRINIDGAQIILPFYSGAPGQLLPPHVVNDYKREDGWVMVYNLITDPYLYQPYRNIFMLYNKFRGILRVFYYNSRTPTHGQVTFAGINFTDPSTKLLNASNVGIYCLPLNQTGPQQVYTTNNIISASKSLCLGWNSFDVEVSYDENYKIKSSNMGISFNDILSLAVNLNGKVNTQELLSYVETSSSNPMGDFIQSFFNSVGTASGKEAEKFIFPPNTTGGTRDAGAIIISAAVSSFISNAINALTKSWTSILAKETNTYKTIDIKTASKLTIEGNIGEGIPSRGIGVQNLLVPGTTPNGSTIIKPIYNAPLGVWNLKTLKNVEIGSYTFPTIENIEGGYPTSDDSYPFYADVCEYVQVKIPTYGVNDVIINDSILNSISKYEVKSEVFYKKRNNNEDAINDSILLNHSSLWIRNNSEKYYPVKEKHYVEKSYWQYLNSDNFERRQTSSTYFDPSYYKFISKVTVLLYPKAPYNTDIVSLTRSFECKTIQVSTPSKGRAVIGAYY